MEYWSNGIKGGGTGLMEEWSTGDLWVWVLPILHYSNTPMLRYSNILVLHHSAQDGLGCS